MQERYFTGLEDAKRRRSQVGHGTADRIATAGDYAARRFVSRFAYTRALSADEPLNMQLSRQKDVLQLHSRVSEKRGNAKNESRRVNTRRIPKDNCGESFGNYAISR